MMMRSDSEKLNSLIERTFVTSSHVAATPAIHVPIMSLPSYGKSLKKEKHHKQVRFTTIEIRIDISYFLEEYLFSSIPFHLMLCFAEPKPMPNPKPEPEPKPSPKEGKTDHNNQIPILS